MGKAAAVSASRQDPSALLSLLDLNNNSTLLVVVSSLFALWLVIYLFPQKEEKEKGGEEGKEVKEEWRLVETVEGEGFDISSFLEVLRAGKFRVLTSNEPLLLRLTLNEASQLTYREESTAALDNHEKHPEHHASSLREVKLQGDTVKLVFIEGDDMIFRCQSAEESSQISEGLASLVSALANNPALLTRELDSPVRCQIFIHIRSPFPPHHSLAHLSPFHLSSSKP